ncbi:MAG: hypothetical protein QM775_01835 [Pirellulales bacterium]
MVLTDHGQRTAVEQDRLRLGRERDVVHQRDLMVRRRIEIDRFDRLQEFQVGRHDVRNDRLHCTAPDKASSSAHVIVPIAGPRMKVRKITKARP